MMYCLLFCVVRYFFLKDGPRESTLKCTDRSCAARKAIWHAIFPYLLHISQGTRTPAAIKMARHPCREIKKKKIEKKRKKKKMLCNSKWWTMSSSITSKIADLRFAIRDLHANRCMNYYDYNVLVSFVCLIFKLLINNKCWQIVMFCHKGMVSYARPLA